MGCEGQFGTCEDYELMLSLISGNNVFVFDLFPTTHEYMDFLEWANETYLFLSFVLLVLNENPQYDSDESSTVLHVIAKHLCEKHPNKGDFHSVVNYLEELMRRAIENEQNA